MSYIPRAALDDRYVDMAGDTMTANLVIQPSSPALPARVVLDSQDNLQGGLAIMRNDEWRWAVGQNADPETGSDAGSDFEISRFDDGQVMRGPDFVINRATGLITVAGDPVDDLGVATKQFTEAAVTAHEAAGDPHPDYATEQYVDERERAASTDTTTDWDTVTDPGPHDKLLRGNNPNGPDGTTNYYYLTNYIYSSGSNLTQVAVPYIADDPQAIWLRSRYQGTWRAWQRLGANRIYTAAVTITVSNSSSGTEVVSFPSGFFSSAPKVSAICAGRSNWFPYIWSGPTTSSVTIGVREYEGTSQSYGVTVHITAIQ